jgi:hypothetical protein
MRSLVISLAISTDEFQRLYQGSVKEVLAFSQDGRRVRFPAAILRPFVLHNGVQGAFEISFDENNRFQAIKRLN